MNMDLIMVMFVCLMIMVTVIPPVYAVPSFLVFVENAKTDILHPRRGHPKGAIGVDNTKSPGITSHLTTKVRVELVGKRQNSSVILCDGSG